MLHGLRGIRMSRHVRSDIGPGNSYACRELPATAATRRPAPTIRSGPLLFIDPAVRLRHRTAASSRPRESSAAPDTELRRAWSSPALRRSLPELPRPLLRRAFAVRQLPVRPGEVAVVAVGVALEVVLVFGLGLPERAGLADRGHDLAGPQAGGVDVGDCLLGDAALLVARDEDLRAV